MVTPLVVKQALTSLAHTGSIVGQLYAVSTAGSIVGVYLAGFVLIALARHEGPSSSWSQWCFWSSPSCSVGCIGRAGLAAMLLVGTLALAGNAARPSVRADNCTLETNYFCIRVTEVQRRGQDVVRLQLDQLVHSFNSISNPQVIIYGYVEIAAETAQYVAEREPRFRSLFLGWWGLYDATGAGGTLSRGHRHRGHRD